MRAIRNNQGLLYGCNTFTSCWRDILIKHDGVHNFQGYGSVSAGNIFSRMSMPDGDLKNISNRGLEYYHHGGSSMPLYYTMNSYISLQYAPENVCPSRLGEVHSFDSLLTTAELEELKINYDEKFDELIVGKYNYEQLIDGGNSSLLMQQVMSTWSNDVWHTRQELLSLSPYLSVDFLRDLVNSNTLPQAILFEIILANPEATFGEEFLDFMRYDSPVPFSETQIDLVIESWENPTPRESLERMIANSERECVSIANRLSRHYLFDASPGAADSLMTWLNTGYTFDRQLAGINERFNLSNYPQAAEELGSLLSMTSNENELATLNRMTMLNEFLEWYSQSSTNFYEMEEEYTNNLYQFALEANDLVAEKAKNILKFYKGYEFPAYNESFENTRLAKSSLKKVARTLDASLKVFPNPAKNHLSFEMLGMSKEVELEVYNTNGQLVIKQIIVPVANSFMLNTTTWENGLYYYRFLQPNSTALSGKFMIQK